MKPSRATMSPHSVLIALFLSACSISTAQAKEVAPGSSSEQTVVLQTPEPHTAQEHNNRAVELGSKELWVDAIREHELAVELDQNNETYRTNLSAAHLLYGKSCKEKHRLGEAADQLRSAIFVDPNNAEADRILDDLISQTGKVSSDAAYRKSLAESANQAGDFEVAIVEYRKSLQLHDDGPTRMDLARCLLRTGLVVDAFKEFSTASIKSWPADQATQKSLSDCNRYIGDILGEYAQVAKDEENDVLYRIRLKNAGIAYRKALTVNPYNTNAVIGLIDVSQKAIALNPSFDNHLTLAGAYQLQGDFDRAKMELSECKKLSPNSTDLSAAQKSLLLAVVKSSAASPEMLSSALADLNRQLKKSPSDAQLWYIYAVACERKADFTKALDAYNQASSFDSSVATDLHSRMAAVKERIAATNLKSGTTAQIQDLCTSSNAGSSPETIKKYSEIESMILKGNLDQAKAAVLAQIKDTPHAGRAWLLLGLISERGNDSDFAIAAYRQAQNLNEPGAEGAAESLNAARVAPMIAQGDEQAKSGDWVKATSSYRQAIILNRDLSALHRKLADALQHLGDATDAKLERQRAEELDQMKPAN